MLNQRFANIEPRDLPMSAPVKPAIVNSTRDWKGRCSKFLEFTGKVKEQAQTKEDEIVPEKYVRLNADCSMKYNGLPLTKDALLGLTRLTAMPQAMVKWLDEKKFHSDLARFVNLAMDERPKVDEGTLLVRQRLEGGQKVVRAVLSERYGIADNHIMTEMIMSCLPEKVHGEVLSSHTCNNGDNIFGNIILPKSIKTRPDSDYYSGVVFRNSEIGNFSFKVGGMLFREFCMNGLIYSPKSTEITVNKRHVGGIDFEDLFLQVELAIQTSLAENENLLRIMDMTRDIKVNDVKKMIITLARQNPNRRLNNSEIKAWLEAYTVEPIPTAFGVLNAGTRAAQNYVGEGRVAMEELAGTLMTDSLDATEADLRKRWNRYNNNADVIEEKVLNQFVITL